LNILQAMLHRNFTLKIYPRNLHQIHVGWPDKTGNYACEDYILLYHNPLQL
jgi:hypothetical protein